MILISIFPTHEYWDMIDDFIELVIKVIIINNKLMEMQNNNRVWIKIKELKNMIGNLWSIILGIKKIIWTWWLRLTWKHSIEKICEKEGRKRKTLTVWERRESKEVRAEVFERERVKMTFRLFGGTQLECDFLHFHLSFLEFNIYLFIFLPK